MSRPSISDAIKERGITEILHFTTSNGFIGSMTTGSVLSHARLPTESRLAHILQMNCKDRSRDVDWHDYVNLSISRINGTFFSIARDRWHAAKDIYWCILSFDPSIADHPGALFSTTNNAYPYTVRAPGIDGFESLFGPKVRQFAGKWVFRSREMPANHTTCHQAELLYPAAVSLEYLRKVYFPSGEFADEAVAQLGVCAPSLLGRFQLEVNPVLFGERHV
ncbi:DarT ssDNA thymidine ADP-ribosyltransferase family protein [Burkholderia ubonensis]|uniref:DarT ssDNA thymidine ADP-ribosyltransferase family protein n=1 Tax=Burkholderia ubonensis TaxID=101571 RepID=UPI0012F7F5CD|nr:DarT ssDNA thymidine ADP-ribosyltransferase family protein [Burkholderia ubonensis]